LKTAPDGPELLGEGECRVTQASEPDVILYTHPDCAFSAAAKMDYRKRKIAYTDVDLSKETDKIPALLALTGGERVTPVIVDHGTVTIGFKGGT
jgi:glutaredoxin